MLDSPTRRKSLLEAARRGDLASLGQLLLDYETYLTLLVRSRLGADLRSKADPADVVQAAFLDAHRQFPNFRGDAEAEFTAWLRTLVAGQLALVMRRFLGTTARDARLERRIAQEIDDASSAVDRALLAPGSSPSQGAARRERALLLAEALEKLPPDDREVIVLRHVEGLAFNEVARRMDRTPNAVQKLWVRSLGRLKVAMEELGYEHA